MAKRALKKKSILAPQTVEEASVWLREIGEKQRTLDAAETELNNKIEKLKASYDEKIAESTSGRDELLLGLQIFAEGHREEILPPGSKTVQLITGTIAWRNTPPKVTLEGEEEIIEQIKTLKLERFLRIKTDVDKEAMLKEKDVATAIKGVTISSTEEFIVKPSQTNVEFSAAKGKVKIVPEEKVKKEAKPKKASKKVPA